MFGGPDWGTRAPRVWRGCARLNVSEGEGNEAVPKPTPRTATSHGKGHACVWPSSTACMANANDTQDADRLRGTRDDRHDPRADRVRRRHSAERDGNRESGSLTDGYARPVADR